MSRTFYQPQDIVVAEEASTNENAFQFFTLCFAVLLKL